MDYSDAGRLLTERFLVGKTQAELEHAELDWEALKQRLAIGQSVTGEVVAKSHFGAWIDIGVGFPALLRITDIVGLTPERSRAGDWCPIGSEVAAFVSWFDDRNHQIGLLQVQPAH